MSVLESVTKMVVLNANYTNYVIVAHSIHHVLYINYIYINIKLYVNFMAD